MDLASPFVTTNTRRSMRRSASQARSAWTKWLLEGACSSPLILEALTVHPPFWLDFSQPIRRRWDSSQILCDVLFSQVADGNLLPIAVTYRDSKHLLGHEDPF